MWSGRAWVEVVRQRHPACKLADRDDDDDDDNDADDDADDDDDDDDDADRPIVANTCVDNVLTHTVLAEPGTFVSEPSELICVAAPGSTAIVSCVSLQISLLVFLVQP